MREVKKKEMKKIHAPTSKENINNYIPVVFGGSVVKIRTWCFKGYAMHSVVGDLQCY